MPGFFYKLGYHLGRQVGPKLRQANWIVRSLTGTEEEAIRAERAVGRDLEQAFASQFEPCPDPAVRDLVTGLGSRLAGKVENREWRFRFHVVEAREVNAFALPGGVIFLTRSMTEFCAREENELAFILGHEIGHAVRRHAMDRMMANTALSAALLGLAPAGGLAGRSLATLATTFCEQSYSRDQEMEADRFGVQLARSAGFDPAAAIRLLKRLKATTGELEGLGSYFSSHPPLPLEERIQNLQQALGKPSEER
jgi:predicted Zn-dependent protease